MFQRGTAELLYTPEGKLVSNTVIASRQQLMDGLEESGDSWTMLVFDMSSVNDIDVRGIQLIIESYKLAFDQDKQFMLVNVHESILQNLQLFRLHTKFPIGIDKTSAQLKSSQWEESK